MNDNVPTAIRPQHVSMICPRCRMICGWNERRKIYDAVRVESDNPNVIQYAHEECVTRD